MGKFDQSQRMTWVRSLFLDISLTRGPIHSVSYKPILLSLVDSLDRVPDPWGEGSMVGLLSQLERSLRVALIAAHQGVAFSI